MEGAWLREEAWLWRGACPCLSFPPAPQARIKKIMQTDEEIGKVAAAVPVIICILMDQRHRGHPTMDIGVSPRSGHMGAPEVPQCHPS